MGDLADTTILDLTAQIVVAHVENNQVASAALPGLIRSVYLALATAAAPEVKPTNLPVPAVPIKRSVFPNYLVCLEDGRQLQLLKRHLRTSYNLSPAEYRTKWGLPPDYPMVAPNHAAARSILSKRSRPGRTSTNKADALTTAGSDEHEIAMLPARRARGSRG